jgi:hypothetical protein
MRDLKSLSCSSDAAPSPISVVIPAVAKRRAGIHSSAVVLAQWFPDSASRFRDDNRWVGVGRGAVLLRCTLRVREMAALKPLSRFGFRGRLRRQRVVEGGRVQKCAPRDAKVSFMLHGLTFTAGPRRRRDHANFVFQALLEDHYPRGADGALGYDELAQKPADQPRRKPDGAEIAPSPG